MSEVAASASLGPRYAPEDPTLPKPWMGLIDGSTGLQYYWNPETNITQYERPAGGPPPLPPGPPPPVTTSSLAAVPTSQNSQSNGPQGQPVQQIFQQSAQQPQQQLGQQNHHQQGGLQMPYQQAGQQVYPQQGHQMSYLQSDQQLQNQRAGQQFLQHSLGQQLLRQPSPQQQPPSQQLLPQQLAEHQLQPGQQVPQTQPPTQQLPQKQLGQQQLPHQQLEQQLMHQQSGQQQLPHQQPGQQQFPYQQPGVQLRPQVPHQTSQHFSYQQVPFLQGQKPPGQQLAFQNIQQPGFQSMDEPSLRNWKPSDFSTTEPQPSGGIPPKPNLSAGIQQAQVPHLGVRPPQSQHQFSGFLRGDAQQSGATSFQVLPNVNTMQLQDQIGGGVRPPSQVGPRMIANRMSMGSPAGINELEDDKNDKLGDEFYSGRPKDFPGMGQMQPKLAPLPLPRNVQDTRIGAASPQMFSPGHSAGFNMGPVRPMQNMYNNASLNQPFPNGLQMGSSPEMLGSSDPRLSAVDSYRKQHEVTAMGENIPAPFITFETTGFPPEILREMHFAGFLSPTPIQAQTWPLALQGRDIVAIAKTGSGKTLGYLVPAFLHLRQFRNNPQMGPTVLVLAPTRELATQIQDEAVKFGRSSGISCTCLYGGAPKGPQLREIERGAAIVVATPGRLNDILEMNKISFRQVSFLVLDEADRMLDMGFEPQIRKIVNEIPPRRQTLMYTATWPKEVRKIAGDLLLNPVQVNIGNINELAANKAITQYVEVVPPMMKDRRLEEILRSEERGSKIIIFCSTKRLCDQLARGIGSMFGATAIHGDKSQGERDWALNQFRSGKSPILVATDVAARGLDIKDIRVVINYDFPTGVEDYVHRIGRTGRAGATGVAYTFFSDQDWKYAVDLIKILEGANQRVPPELREMAVRGGPVPSKDRAGISRWDSGGARFDTGGPRGIRDGGYGGRGGREGGFGGRGGRDVGGFGGRGGRDGGFGGRGGRDGFDGFGGRDSSGFGGRGGRSDFYGSRGGRGRGFGGPGGMGRGGRGPNDRHGYMEGRGRFDSRRPMGPRSRGRSYSRSPDRGRSWSRHRSRSISRSRSRSRSWTRSRSYSRSRSRSRSRSFDVPQRNRRASGFDVLPTQNVVPPPVGEMSPMSPGTTNAGTFPMTEPIIQIEQALLTDGATASDVPSSGT